MRSVQENSAGGVCRRIVQEECAGGECRRCVQEECSGGEWRGPLLSRLRFHKNLSFEKITENRYSGTWIGWFSFCGAWNLTDCLYF